MNKKKIEEKVREVFCTNEVKHIGIRGNGDSPNILVVTKYLRTCNFQFSNKELLAIKGDAMVYEVDKMKKLFEEEDE